MDQHATLHSLVERLDTILDEVKNSRTPLDKSLDLLDEAVTVGLAAVSKVDLEPLGASEALKPMLGDTVSDSQSASDNSSQDDFL